MPWLVESLQPDHAGTMREKLVCYLLGELDDQERAHLEMRLAAEPALRKELEQIRACMQATDADPECPDGLASRTADSIARLSGDDCLGDRVDTSCGRGRWSMVDIGVAAGVLLAVGMMVLPAMPRTREATRRTMCEENMRQIGQALHGYASDHGSNFPFIYPNENAGMFAVRLVESGQMSQTELSRLLRCRASSLQNGTTRITIHVPRTQELQQARGQALAMLRRWMAGSYAYRLGYVEQGKYQPMNFNGGSRSPILCDSPLLVKGQWVRINHGSQGQNVLHQDGHVRFEVGSSCPTMDCKLFVNREGKAAAGQGAGDFVLVRSDLTPGVPPSIKVAAPKILLPGN